MKKIALITGGAGFIGSHLSDLLINKGYFVICMDNLLTGSKDNIRHLLKDKNFRFIKHDVTKYINIKGRIDCVLHFASPASPIDYLKYPIKTLKVGSLGTHNALGVALSKKAKFLLASTSEVYGDPLEHPQKESYWGNVNPIGVRGCFSEDTEILTKNGWKFFPQLTTKEEIATLNEKGYIEYHKPTDFIKERYEGELIKFRNYKIDLLVTPNHKMYVKKRNKGSFRLIEAFECIRWDRAEMLKSAKWNGKREEWFQLPLVKNTKLKQQEKIKMDLWLEFFGYFITEGCAYLRYRKQRINGKDYTTKVYATLVSQSKKNKIKRDKIRACLEKLGFNFFEENAQFKILSKQLYMYLSQFGKAKQKYIPKEFLLLSEEQIKILFNAMMLGDGSWDGRRFYSSSTFLIDAMQEILLKLGMAGSVTVKDASKGTKIIFILTNKRKDFLTPKYPKRTIEKYNGYVYCVNIPNHIIYVRRNGKALWCGNCYDEAKRFSEAITMAYHRAHGVDVKIVRIFNTYGERMRHHDGRAIPNFIDQALKNKPITVYGKGKQTRSFCYIDDLKEGIYRLLGSKAHYPVNIGNDHEFSILELARVIIDLTGSKSKIVFKELPVNDPKVRRPDITLAKRILKWTPKVKLIDGLKKTIDYFRFQNEQ